MLELIKESVLLGVIGSSAATVAIFLFNWWRLN